MAQLIRYALKGASHYGLLDTEKRIARLRGLPFDGLHRSGDIDDVSSVKLLAPIDRPRIFGLGYNYTEHSREAGKKEVPEIPVLFMKPSTSVIGPDESIVYPDDAENVHFEGELTVVIGKTARYVEQTKALDFVFGYTCGNDVSDRVLQRKESKFGCLLAGKGYDTFAPVGPVIATGLDPSNLPVITRSQRRGSPERHHGRSSVLGAIHHFVPQSVHDATARRLDHDRHPGRGRADQGGG